jgi:hypothetical protein
MSEDDDSLTSVSKKFLVDSEDNEEDSDDDVFYSDSEDSDDSDSEEDSDYDFGVKPPPAPSPSAASTGVASLKTTTERASQSEEPLCSPCDLSTMFKELPPTLILDFLDMKSRSRLQLTCKLIQNIVAAFDKDLAVGVFTKSPKCGNPRAQLRQDLEECTARHGWLAENDEHSYLQRIRDAHFHKYEELGGRGVRANRFYETALIADGNLWVLWYDYCQSFEMFDLDTGKAFTFYPDNGPDSYYVNTEEVRIRLMLDDDFDARFGLLCATMFLTSGAPHGPGSGPYLHVWELPSTEKEGGKSRLHVDLRRPDLRVVEVIIVSKDKCVILLESRTRRGFHLQRCKHCDAAEDEECEHPCKWGTGGVLQWHRIPDSDKEMSGPPPAVLYSDPGRPPPEHRCGMNCLMVGCPERLACSTWKWNNNKWQEQCLAQENGKRAKTKDSDESKDDDAKPEYSWWPCEATLMSEHEISFHDDEHVQDLIENDVLPDVSFRIQSDGKGLLVLLVWNEIQFWHVGSQKLVRTCPLGETFYPLSMRVGAFATHTVIYRGSQNEDIPQSAMTNDASLLSEYGIHALLANFARRGSPPQYQCVVRIALSVCEESSLDDQALILLDVQPFQHLSSLEDFHVAHIPVESSIEERESTDEQLLKFQWRRGGGLDGFGGGRTELQLDIQESSYYRAQMDGREIGALVPFIQSCSDASKALDRQRMPLKLFIDAHKLVVVTSYEVSVWPLAIGASRTEAWIQQMTAAAQSSEVREYDLYERLSALYLDKDIKPWYSAYPLQHTLFQRIKERLGLTCEEEEFANTAVFNAVSPEQRLHLLHVVSDWGPSMTMPSISWRYFATAIIPDATINCECWKLKAFDVLGAMRTNRGIADVNDDTTCRRKRRRSMLSKKFGVAW